MINARRKNIMLGTAGHVDHGKTALVKMLTGCNTDRLKEEQQRGLTIDLGYAPCRMYDERIIGIVDVPGHVDFIRNMVAGVQGIDAVIFVVAANDGVMPQSREHLQILTLLGVRHGLVALTKVDTVDADRLRMVSDDVRQFISGTFLADAPICPLSNITGEGFEEFFRALNAVVTACEARESSGLFRMWVSEVFSARGFGTVVSGIPGSGVVHVGDKLHLTPGEQVGRVRQLEVYGEKAEEGRAGECVALNMTDLQQPTLTRGAVLCAGDMLAPVSLVEAELRLLDTVAKPLKDYLLVHLHLGTAETMAHIAVLDDSALFPARTHLVQLRLREPLGIAPGDRFVIRAGVADLVDGHLTTLGGGRILGVSNARLRRNRPWTLEMLAARRAALDSPLAWCAQLIREQDGVLSMAELARRAFLPIAQTATLLQLLLKQGLILEAPGPRYMHRDVLQTVARRIADALQEFHTAQAMALGLDEGALRERLAADPAVFRTALEQLLAGKSVVRQGVVVALAGRSVMLSSEDQTLLRRIEERLAAAGLTPPMQVEFAAIFATRPERVEKLVKLLIDRGVLARLDPTLVMHQHAVNLGIQAALRLFKQAGAFSTMEFRDALGVSRKYAVPLLDYLDVRRITVRNGNRRTPGMEAKKILSPG